MPTDPILVRHLQDAKSGAVRVGIADSAPQGSIGDSNKNSNSGSDDTGGLPTVKMQLREAAIAIGATRFGSGMPIVGKQSEVPSLSLVDLHLLYPMLPTICSHVAATRLPSPTLVSDVDQSTAQLVWTEGKLWKHSTANSKLP
jgi:hypothetical protein